MWPITDVDLTLAEVEAGPLQDLVHESGVQLDRRPSYRLGTDERGKPLLIATAPARPLVPPEARRRQANRKTPERSHSTTVTAP